MASIKYGCAFQVSGPLYRDMCHCVQYPSSPFSNEEFIIRFVVVLSSGNSRSSIALKSIPPWKVASVCFANPGRKSINTSKAYCCLEPIRNCVPPLFASMTNSALEGVAMRFKRVEESVAHNAASVKRGLRKTMPPSPSGTTPVSPSATYFEPCDKAFGDAIIIMLGRRKAVPALKGVQVYRNEIRPSGRSSNAVTHSARAPPF